MTFYYDIETKNGTVNYEFEPTYDDIRKALIYILKSKGYGEILSIMEELVASRTEVEDYFEDELHEYFESDAKISYEDSIQTEEDYYYDYYHDKL